MDVVVRPGACGDLDLRLNDIPLSKCHLVSFVSTCSRPERFDHHAKVQRRCYTGWTDDVRATHVAVSDEVSHIALTCYQTALAHTVRRPRSCWRSRQGSRNRKTGCSRVHVLAHQSVYVPMPWRKLFAFTSHDISRCAVRSEYDVCAPLLL
jgi:hypothetical protein